MTKAWEVGKGWLFVGHFREIRVSKITDYYVYLEDGRHKLARKCSDHEVFMTEREARERHRQLIAEQLATLDSRRDELVAAQQANTSALDEL